MNAHTAKESLEEYPDLVPVCDECARAVDSYVYLGGNAGDSDWAVWICIDCLQKAVALLKALQS